MNAAGIARRLAHLEERVNAVARCAMDDHRRYGTVGDYWTRRYTEVTTDLRDTRALLNDMAATA